jgi:hypothetical protein
MSNHFSADNLKFPGDDRRLDLTDVFVFRRPPARNITTHCSTVTTPARPC